MLDVLGGESQCIMRCALLLLAKGHRPGTSSVKEAEKGTWPAPGVAAVVFAGAAVFSKLTCGSPKQKRGRLPVDRVPRPCRRQRDVFVWSEQRSQCGYPVARVPPA